MGIISNIKADIDFRSLIKYLYENPFNIMGASDYEIRHSKVIAWLLDPTSGHGFSEFVFRQLLVIAIQNYGKRFQVTDLSDIKIYTEWVVESSGERIDIVGVSETNNFVIVVENKVNASQRDGQLTSYRKAIETKYSGYTYYPFFLSLFGDAPGEEDEWYMVLSYSNVISVLVSLLEKIGNGEIGVSPRIHSFIEDYKNTVSKHVYADDKILNFGEILLQKYRSIIQRVEDYENDFSQVEYSSLKIVQEHMKSVPNLYFQLAYTKFLGRYSEQFGGDCPGDKIVHVEGFYKGRTEFWFVPEAIYNEQYGKVNSTSWKSPVPFAYFFIKQGNKIILHAELGPLNFLQKSSKVSNRNELIKYIKEDEKGEWGDLSPRENTQKWVKLFSDSREVPSWSSKEVVFSIMEDLYTNGFSTINGQVFALINELFEA